MNKFTTLGCGVALLLSMQVLQADNLLGIDTRPIQSDVSFNNGIKMYGGASIGYGSQGNTCNMPFFEGSCDDGDLTIKAFGGVRINPMLGAELGYVSLGETEKKGNIANQAASITNKLSGFQLNAVGYLPVNSVPNLELFGKGGVMFWERDTKATLGDLSTPSKDDGISPMAGIGAQYQIDQNLHLRSEWEHVFNTGSNSDYETDADNYSVGLMYSTL